jgi:Insecticide toxin TcdB middle/N-terminal region
VRERVGFASPGGERTEILGRRERIATAVGRRTDPLSEETAPARTECAEKLRAYERAGAQRVFLYAPSTRFYLEDLYAGNPWVTRPPFPVHVVERVEILDWIGRSRTVNRYAYHHGHYDGVEREFRGFGMVEEWDTESHRAETSFPVAENWDVAPWSPVGCQNSMRAPRNSPICRQDNNFGTPQGVRPLAPPARTATRPRAARARRRQLPVPDSMARPL